MTPLSDAELERLYQLYCRYQRDWLAAELVLWEQDPVATARSRFLLRPMPVEEFGQYLAALSCDVLSVEVEKWAAGYAKSKPVASADSDVLHVLSIIHSATTPTSGGHLHSPPTQD